MLKWWRMSTTRSLRPTDLVALVSLDGRVYPNEARTWDRLGRRPEGLSRLESALEPWFSFATGRHTWISVQGQTIRSLISARRRGNRTVWEVDCLVAATDDESALLNLFEQVSAGAGAAGVQSIFLRLGAASEVLHPARRAGFIPYASETLLRLDARPQRQSLARDVSVRRRTASDGFALYRLYNAGVPEAVRRMEAPTYQHWLASREKRRSGRSQRDDVVLRAGEVVAHFCCSREADLSRLDLSLHPAHADLLELVLTLALEHAAERLPLFCLAPSYAPLLREQLLGYGFSVDSEYVLLMKRTAVPLKLGHAVRLPAPVTHPLAVVCSVDPAGVE